MTASLEGTRRYLGTRNYGLVWLGSLVVVLGLLVCLFIGSAICLHLYDGGATGVAHSVDHIGSVMTTPFHHVFGYSTFKDPTNRFIANNGLAAFIYLLAGVILGALLRRLSWVGGPPPRV